MDLNTYLNFQGNCREAFEFYRSVFGGDFSIFETFGEAPDDMEMSEGMAYNMYFPGHQIAMAAPLSDDLVEYADGTEATVPQMAKDVTNFLVWAAEPELEERKRMGVKVVLFLLLLTGMLFAVKRAVWSNVPH